MADETTIYDIARRAGVGIATVSRVLNGSDRVAPATRDAVRAAMDDLGYRPNRAARRLAVRGPNRPRVVALMPMFSTNFYFSASRPLAQGLARANMDLVIHDVEDRPMKLRLVDRVADERSAEGLIMCSMGIGPERQERFLRLGVPVICVDYLLPGLPSVTVDNRAGAAMAAAHLTAGGSKRLGLIGGPSEAVAFRLREEGFVAAVGAAAPVARAEAITREAGRVAVAELLERDAQLDGIVAVNDLLALGALEELRSRGCRVPDDIQVIGFDDQPLMDALGLSTVHQPMPAFGAWAAEAMQSLLTNPRAEVPSRQLPLTLVARATTREAPRKRGK